uniref:Leucine-rich repeat-containing N-terminal plant-type domain-containing protein n=1 Tax=Aegilops tauschii subsp. strangulata TaxID=200361 RepID=A0A453DSV5_AEGTS
MLLMYSNQIEGRIPESMCKLQSLLYLDLSNNILESEIPQCFDGKQIQFLLLSNNSLSGKFPAFLQNSTRLKFLDLAWNKFSGRLPAISSSRSARSEQQWPQLCSTRRPWCSRAPRLGSPRQGAPGAPNPSYPALASSPAGQLP